MAAYADTEAPPQGASESLDQPASVEEHAGLNESLAIDIEDSAHGNYSDDCHFLSFEEWKKQKELEAQEEPPKVSSTSMGNALETIKEDTVSLLLLDVEVEDQGKTYKDKFNYASGDCAATVVKTNSDAKGALAILSEVKDLYLLNKCATPNKFVVIELCQDILVSSIVMANFELFSSMFRKVRFQSQTNFLPQAGKSLARSRLKISEILRYSI